MDGLLDIRLDKQARLAGVTALHTLAAELGVRERTLRRAVGQGAIRAERPSARRLRVDAAERDWVLQHWPVVRSLREALRTLPDVRLAIMFGSIARGRAHRRSDIDLLVDLDVPTPARLAALAEQLSEVAGREVQIVSIAEADASPALLADIARDGRVVVDRDGHWPSLRRRGLRTARGNAHLDEQQLEVAMRPIGGGR
jgi:predicted nucleotidyltransferase